MNAYERLVDQVLGILGKYYQIAVILFLLALGAQEGTPRGTGRNYGRTDGRYFHFFFASSLILSLNGLMLRPPRTPFQRPSLRTFVFLPNNAHFWRSFLSLRVFLWLLKISRFC